MASTNFHLVALKSDITEASFLSAVRDLSAADRPLYIGKCQHWIHAPHLSAAALTGPEGVIKRWDYLIIIKAPAPDSLALPKNLSSLVEENWSITVGVTNLDNFSQAQRDRLAQPDPPLPEGWSPGDHSGLDAAEPPSDLEASLALSAYPLGSRTDGDQKPVGLKDFTRDFGTKHTGAVCMFNLLSYLPNQRPRYFEYIAAFSASVGSKYGGDAMFMGLGGVSDWTSKADATAQAQEGEWEDVALIHYPSIWHFSKMLDDPGYMDADRRFKQGVLRDNPLMCCTEIEMN